MNTQNKTYRIRRTLILLPVLLAFAGCTKLVEVNAPVTTINGVNVYASDPTAISVLTGIYTKISNADMLSGGILSLSLFPSLSADELTLFDGITTPYYLSYYENALTNSNAGSADYWVTLYPIIYMANSAIEGLTASGTLTPAVRQQLIGEAKFIRAFCYFYLVNLYGEVPLVLGTDYSINAGLSRAPVEKVWGQVIADLKEAQALLSQNYLDGTLQAQTSERVRPTQSAARALLARAYLFSGDWTNAELQSTEIINNVGMYSLNTDLNAAFLANNSEAVWQLQPVNFGENTQAAKIFILPESGPSNPSHPVYLSSYLLTAFEGGDLRKEKWIDSVTTAHGTYYYPYKWKVGLAGEPVTEYETVLRLSEQYLIRSEARTQKGDVIGAVADINIIRSRAGLANYVGPAEKASLLKAIIHERQVELFCEWGHRWLDLKRTGMVNDVMTKVTPSKGGTWNQNWQWYPIALSELRLQPTLVQNTGY